MGLKEHQPTIEYLVDLVIEVADGAELPDGRRAGSRSRHGRGLLHSQPRPRGRGRHRHAEGAAAHDRDPAHLARLVAGGGAVRQGPRGSGGGGAGSRSRSAAAGTRRCSGRRCSSWRGTTSPRRWTAANPRSSCTPAAACWRGAAGCARASAATTSWPTACCSAAEPRDAGDRPGKSAGRPLPQRRPVAPTPNRRPEGS